MKQREDTNVHQNGGILNPRLIAAIVALGHGESIVVSDAGLPVPAGVEVLDLSLVAGVPGFCQTLEAVVGSLQVETAIVATELTIGNPVLDDQILRLVQPAELTHVDHAHLKSLVGSARLVVRTGETTPYANVILVGGITF